MDDMNMLDDKGPGSPEIERYRELMQEARQEDVWFEGRGGPLKLYHYRISNRTVRVTHLEGWLFMALCPIAFLIMGAIVGLIMWQGDAKVGLDYMWVWIIAVPCCVCGCVLGVVMGFKRVTNTMETRLIMDVALKRSWMQNRKKNGTGKLLMYTLDPTTPLLVAKIGEAEEIYERLVDYIYKRAKGPDAPEPAVLFEKEYGIRVPKVFCGFCGCYGLLPTRKYTFRDWDITVENRNCWSMRRDHLRREAIYDITLRYNCFQLLLKKCLRDRANVWVYTLDMSSGHVNLRLRDAEKEFDNLRKDIDAVNAADGWFQRTRLAGFMASADVL